MADQKTKIIIETDAGRSEQVLRNVQNGLKGVNGQAGKTGKGVSASAKSMNTSLLALAGAAAAATVSLKKTYDIAKNASQLSEARLYLQTFTADIGVSFDQLEQATRKSTRGLVDNLTLIRKNHRALKTGVSTDVSDIARLWEIADSVGDELGQSMEQTFDQMVTAISEGNARMLMKLGILPKNFKRVSTAAGITAKRVELLNEVFKQAGPITDSLAAKGDTASDKFQRLTTATNNLRMALGEGLIPTIIPLVERLADMAKGIDEIVNAADRVKRVLNTNKSAAHMSYLREAQEQVEKERAEIEARIERNTAITKESAPWYKSEIAFLNQDIRPALESIEKDQQRLVQLKAIEKEIENSKRATKDANEEMVKLDKNVKKAGESTLVLKDKTNEFAKIAEKAEKEIKNITNELINGWGVKGVASIKEAEQVLLAATAAVGGLSAGFVDGVEKAGELENVLRKIDKIDKSIVSSFSGKAIDPAEYAFRLADFHAAGLLSATGSAGVGGLTGSDLADTKEDLSKIIAEAVTAGFANADFSDFTMSLAQVLSQALSSAVSTSNPIVTAGGGINWGNLGLNLAAGYGSQIVSGLFTTKVKDKHVVQQASNLKNSLSEAYLETFKAELLPYLNLGHQNIFTDIGIARSGAAGATVGYESDTGWSWSDLSWVKSYDLKDYGASSALDMINKTLENAKKTNRTHEMWLELVSAEGRDSWVLNEQYLAVSGALDKALKYENNDPSLTWNWSTGAVEEQSIDLSEEIHQLKLDKIELEKAIALRDVDIRRSSASIFTNYLPWLDTPPSSDYITRMQDTDSAASSVSEQYDLARSLQGSLDNRYIDPYLFEMVKEASINKFELAQLQYTDPEKYQSEYLEMVERQMTAYEEVMSRQEDIFNDSSKSFEERTAALELFESSMEAYHQAKLEKIAREEQQEAEIAQKEAERRHSQIESALSLVGELNQRSDKIVILQANDSTTAIQELLAEFSDNPEVSAILNATLAKEQAKARWGN